LQSVDVGDFNLDGKHDLVTANAVTTLISVLLGKGDGTFETSVDVDAGNNPGDAAVGDFNGDNRLDRVPAAVRQRLGSSPGRAC
jgi:hypothetical protein